jgi:hypothetical protein
MLAVISGRQWLRSISLLLGGAFDSEKVWPQRPSVNRLSPTDMLEIQVDLVEFREPELRGGPRAGTVCLKLPYEQSRRFLSGHPPFKVYFNPDVSYDP